MSVVYVVTTPNLGEQVALSTDQLERWGEVRAINTRYVYADDLIGDDNRMPPQFASKMAVAAAHFNPKQDYLVLMGDHLQVAAFAAELGSVYPCFRVLRWSARERAYYPVLIQTGRGPK